MSSESDDGALVAFLVHPAPDFLRRHVGRSVKDAALITELLRMMARNEPAASQGEWARLREPITAGESRVLRFLPTNLSAPEIAPSAIRIGAYGPGAPAAPVPKARRALPQRGRRAGARPRPARARRDLRYYT
jgi:hypothetical protein